MIRGKVETFKIDNATRQHVGWVEVQNESVTPMDVLSPQLPDVSAGWRRESIEYKNSPDGQRVDFVATDKRA